MITHTGQLVGYYMYDIQDQHFPLCVYYYFPDSASNWYMVCIRTVVIFQYIDNKIYREKSIPMSALWCPAFSNHG